MNVDPQNRPSTAPRPSRRRLRRRPAVDDAARSLERLREALGLVDADKVGDVLPEATAHATGARQAELAIALEPAVTTAVRSMSRRRPELIGEILAPTIGAAVRKAVADAMKEMLDRLDRTLERSFSARSVAWRLEAARTGRPFAEVVLLRTLQYRVEQVFLIHSSSSLVLQHVVDPTLTAQPPDQVAAMLSAVDAFSREALGTVPAETHLDKFELGDLVVWIDRDPLLIVAAVVRGTAGAEIGRRLREARERIFLAHEKDCARFHGDPSPFAAARPELESLLQTQLKQGPRRARLWLAVGAILLLAAIATLSWRAHARSAADARVRDATIAALAREPGIVVTSAEWTHDRHAIRGLRDPLAPAPADVYARSGLAPVPTELTPFVSLDPRIIERRAIRTLEPPASATVKVDDGTLAVAGVAPRAWIEQARVLARSIAGIERCDTHALVAKETVDGLHSIAASVAAIAIPFGAGSSQVGAAEEREVRRVAALAQRGLELAREAHLGACLAVTGHTDPPGTNARNASLSEERAAAVTRLLEASGIDAAHLRARGAAASESAGERTRAVLFRLDTNDRGASCGGEP